MIRSSKDSGMSDRFLMSLVAAGAFGVFGGCSGDDSGDGSESSDESETFSASDDSMDPSSGGSSGDSVGEETASSESSGDETVASEEEQSEWDADRSEVHFPYIWIADSMPGAVVKINTETLMAEGRYLTQEADSKMPSRVSVSIRGDVAVANLNGGVTKIISNSADCDPMQNGMPELQTSTEGMMLPWGQDDCVAWHLPFPYESQRAIAWAGKKQVHRETGEKRIIEKLWVTGTVEAANVIDIRRLNGEDGSDDAWISFDVDEAIANEKAGPTSVAHPFGAYGGVADGDGNFWFGDTYDGFIARVDWDDLSIESWRKPHDAYGFTIDTKGRIWSCWKDIGRFTPENSSWRVVSDDLGSDEVLSASTGGCAVDGNRILWKSGTLVDRQQGLIGVDMDSMEVVKTIPLPKHSHGIAIDFDGFVWGVTRNASSAYKVDPEAGTHEELGPLSDAFTFSSDMTGFRLASLLQRATN